MLNFLLGMLTFVVLLFVVRVLVMWYDSTQDLLAIKRAGICVHEFSVSPEDTIDKWHVVLTWNGQPDPVRFVCALVHRNDDDVIVHTVWVAENGRPITGAVRGFLNLACLSVVQDSEKAQKILRALVTVKEM